MARDTGRQHRVMRCKRCGKFFDHTNFMQRRRLSTPERAAKRLWPDPVEADFWNTHTLACAKKRGERVALDAVNVR